ncbi:hypothetical protein [Nibribacter koreensis]|uniref:hypothetical protein n=1 Tax=Nibribacter koreensis TaxID=1084519 RepID=UPI0031E964C4
MRNFYYQIWIDGIVKMRSRPQNAGVWKYYMMAFTGMAMALNLLVFVSILRDQLQTDFYDLSIHTPLGEKVNGFLEFFIPYLLPCILLNYGLIFYKDRYKRLLGNYKTYDGKLWAIYFIASLSLPFVLLAIAWFLS